MGPQEAPGLELLEGIQAWCLLWLPAKPEAAFGRPVMMEEHGGLRATSVGSVTPW